MTAARRLAARQAVTVALLFAGYAGYYFCRSDYSVALPLLIKELQRGGMDASAATIRLGAIASFGVLAYAAGKFCLGGLGDVWGGRRSFLGGMGGAAAFTLLFAAGGGIPIFTAAWVGNRIVQSMGWAGLVKVCSRWFSYTSYGTIVGILSLSFLLGDAAARGAMGALIEHGYGWRAIFYFAAAVCGGIWLLNLLFLRESRTRLGFAEPEVNPLNVFEDGGPAGQTNTFATRLKPLLLNRGYWIVCLLSLGTTIIRETFNTWTPTYLHNFFSYSAAGAASTSAIFPAVGAVSVIVAGFAGDRLGASGRSIVMFAGLVITTLALFLLTSVNAGVERYVPLVLIGLVAFGLLGPYSYLAGAMALDFGGKEAGATSSGIIDGVGYLGGILAGDSVARLSVNLGWRGVFTALAWVSAASALAAAILFVYQRRQVARRLRLEPMA